MLIRPDITLTMDGAPLPGGAVRTEGERITAVGADLKPVAGEEVVDLPGQVLLPGLINAHCHLDYTGFKGAIPGGLKFTDWIRRINECKRDCSAGDYLAGVARGFELLKAGGCTTVFNIEAAPEILPLLPRSPIRTWWFLELIDLRRRITEEDLDATRKSCPDNFGLSPHAPYTASGELYRLARRRGVPTVSHVAESAEEQEMFSRGRGALYELLKGLGRDMSDCGRGSALARVAEYGLPDLVVHLNYLAEEDFELLRKAPANVAHCPRCHRYFGHARFQYERLREVGCKISIGTDSLASNDVLDLRAELRQFRENYPGVGAEECLRMVTVVPAEQIGKAGELGAIRPGALADLVAFPVANDDPYRTVIESEGPPTFFMTDGRVAG